MPNTIVELTENELQAIKLAVDIAESRLDDIETAKHFTKSEVEAVRFAALVVHDGDLGCAGGDITREQRLTDELWEKFWESRDSDDDAEYAAWFYNGDNDPEGWPEFRDAGLAAAQEAGK